MKTLFELCDKLKGKSVQDQIKLLASGFPGEVIFTTSFGMEDQVITHMIFSNDIPVTVATLDTGRLFPETYKVFSRTLEKYNKEIKVYFPGSAGVEKMVTEKGPFSFYHSKENRMECCRIRKINPLNRALEGMKVWISGIRAGQSESRSRMNNLEWDEDRKLFKFSPLFDWTFEDAVQFVLANKVPANILYSKGYPSIGCEPCTRPVKEGEDARAGRWWWEHDETRECGLHLK